MTLSYKKTTLFGFILMFISWSLVAMQSPFYLDDWGWGTYKLGKDTVSYGGRFIGNFFEMILAGTHNQILNGLFKGLVLTFICFIICLISGKVDVTRLIVFNTLFLLTSMRIVYESFLWTAGFVNYTLPFALILPVILINQRLKNDNYSKINNNILKFFALVLIFASGFFLENLSTTIVFYLATEFILNWIFYRKNIIYSLLSVVVSILSFGIMMLHSERFTNKDGYSMTSFNSFADLVQNIKNVHFMIIDNLFHNDVFLFMVVSSLFLVFLIRILPKITIKKERLLYHFITAQIILSFLCPAYQLVILSPNVINDRVFFPSTVVLIVSGLVLFSFIESEMPNKKNVNRFIGGIFVCSLAFPTLFFVDMTKWNIKLNDANKKAISRNIDINYSEMKPEYYQYYYFDANGPLIGPAWINSYKTYYKIPEDVTVK
ncbi:hypothetical protein RyT2_03880 [Pseudolactococcus yaeyamensis]